MNIFSIFEALPLPAMTIDIVDIGARFIGDERYAPIRDHGAARIVGFEPDDEQLEILKEKYPDQIFLPYFVADGGERDFYICHYGGCSSLYEPNPEIIDNFTGISTSQGSNFEVVETAKVATKRLDDITEISGCDYLKIDVQGAELDVLKGAKERLKECLVVELEVEFVPIYKNQPLFAEIDLFLRQAGFYLHRLMDVSGRAYRPFLASGNISKPVSQLLWADAVFIRRFTDFGDLAPEQHLKMAALTHELYGSVDLSARALAHYDARANTPLQDLYLKEINDKDVELSFHNVKDWSD